MSAAERSMGGGTDRAARLVDKRVLLCAAIALASNTFLSWALRDFGAFVVAAFNAPLWATLGAGAVQRYAMHSHALPSLSAGTDETENT